jgi:capsular polysaccharide biosynthesis protein
MKTILFNGTTYYYKVISWRTNFYILTEPKFKRKYIFFGKKVMIPQYQFAFTVYINIEDESLSKDIIENFIQNALNLYNRKQEILKDGNITALDCKSNLH